METKSVPAGACVLFCCVSILLGLTIGYIAWHRPAGPQPQTIRVIHGGSHRLEDAHRNIQDAITYGK